MHPIRGIFLASLVVMTGCDDLEPNESKVVEADSPEVQLEVEVDTRPDENGDLRTVIQARLTDRSGEQAVPVVLYENDTLEATAAGQTQPFERLPEVPQGQVIYQTAFEPAITDTTLVISVDRRTPPASDPWFPTNDSPEPTFEGLLVNAPNTSVQLLQDFTIDSPAEDEEFLLDDATQVTVTWTPNGVADDRHLLFETRCPSMLSTGDVITLVSTGEVDVEGDPGMVTVDLNTFLENQPEPEAGECEIQILLVAVVAGTPDPVLSDTSAINASLRRSVFIRSVPPGGS